MPNILKKLMAFSMLLIAAGHIKAQVAGNAPEKKTSPVIAQPPALHSGSWYKAEMLKRYPHLSAVAAKHAPLSGMRSRQGPRNYAQMRQELLQRYPQLQQQANIASSARTLSAGNNMQSMQKSSAYYLVLAQQQKEKVRLQVEQIKQRNLQMQQQMQQRPVQQSAIQN